MVVSSGLYVGFSATARFVLIFGAAAGMSTVACFSWSADINVNVERELGVGMSVSTILGTAVNVGMQAEVSLIEYFRSKLGISCQ